ncbi:MAG: DUF1801 domain-containing protein [Thermoanaerobaculia bacterium]
MPTNLKKLVEARMGKTGESYATALRYVRRRGAKLHPTDAPEAAPARAVRVRYPGAARRDPAIDAYARTVEGPLGSTISRLVSLVRSAVPGHDEVLFHGAPSFCIEGEPFCYLVGYPGHVKLGFCDGAALSDPAGLLRGRGKYMRHVRLAPGEPFPTAALAHLVAQSVRRVRARQKADPRGARDVRDARR